MLYKEKYDWIDVSNFLFIANAEISDYNLSKNEISKILEISDILYAHVVGENKQYSSEDVEKKFRVAFNWYNQIGDGVPENKIDQAIMMEVQESAKWLKNQEWWNPDFAKSMINWLIEIAKVDGLNDNFKGSIISLANFWEVKLS